MPSSSHANCKVCRVRIHARNKFGLCPVHQSQYVTRRARERKLAKLRRSARVQQAAQALQALLSDVPPQRIEDDIIQAVAHPRESEAAPVIHEEDHTVPEPIELPAPPAKPTKSVAMSDEHKLVIAGHYANYDIPVEQIVKHYGISNGDITIVADELGVARRDRRNVGKRLPEGHFDGDTWVVDPRPAPAKPPRVEDIPEPQRVALENMLKLPPQPEPMVVSPNGTQPLRMYTTVELPASYAVWAIDVKGKLLVGGVSIEDILARVREIMPDAQITGMNIVGDTPGQ